MPTDHKRLTIIPDFQALATVGRDLRHKTKPDRWENVTLGVNGALGELALLIESATTELDAALTRREWNAIADVMNGCADLYDYSGPQIGPLTLLVGNLQDSEGLGAKWGIDTADLVRRLQVLTPLHGFAILAAVRWFWAHCNDVDHQKHNWWLPRYRRRAVQEG